MCPVLCKRSFSSRTRACCWCPCGRVMRESVLVRAWPSSVAMRLRLTSMRSNGTKHVRDAAAFSVWCACAGGGPGRRVCACDDVRFGIDCRPARRASRASRAVRTTCIGVHILYCYSKKLLRRTRGRAGTATGAPPSRTPHTHKRAHSLRRREKKRERETASRQLPHRTGTAAAARAPVRHADDLSIRIATR